MSSKDKKKYWWYKEYYDDALDHRRKILKKIKHGYEALVVLDEMKKESVGHGGVIRFSQDRAYTNKELANVLDEPIKILEKSLQLLEEYDFIFIQKDNTIVIKDFEKRIGFTTGKAIRMREYRDKNAQMSTIEGSNEQKCSPKSESRVKNIESKDKIIDYLSSSKSRYYSLGMNKDFDNIESMMIKASDITGFVPSKETIVDLLDTIMFKDNLLNVQGYIINCFKKEGEKYVN